MDLALNSEESPDDPTLKVIFKALPSVATFVQKEKVVCLHGRGSYTIIMKYVGVDGCKGGWFAIALTAKGTRCDVFDDFAALWEAHHDAGIILVDMPIGLPGKTIPIRRADSLARKMLGKRHSSVFSPGVRALHNCDNYGDACEVNRKLIGKKISQQYWNIIPKIKDVDLLLQSKSDAVEIVHESHPEIGFMTAAPGMSFENKKTVIGRQQRLAVLEKFISDIREIDEDCLGRYPRKVLARDDILDAAILAVLARESRGAIIPLPDPPERDETGLPMAIWWYDFMKKREEL